MKKQYSKPGIIIENFQMSESIAVACEGVEPGGNGGSLGYATYADKKTCGWNTGGFVYWISEPTCDRIREEDANVNGWCYHNPTAGFSIFSSM